MSNVTPLRPRRLDNPQNPLGRVYCVLRDATYWMDIDEIADSIEARFGEEDSTGMILERIHELMRRGEMIDTRMTLGAGPGRRQYLMAGEWPGGAA